MRAYLFLWSFQEAAVNDRMLHRYGQVLRGEPAEDFWRVAENSSGFKAFPPRVGDIALLRLTNHNPKGLVGLGKIAATLSDSVRGTNSDYVKSVPKQLHRGPVIDIDWHYLIYPDRASPILFDDKSALCVPEVARKYQMGGNLLKKADAARIWGSISNEILRRTRVS